jgi:hypothetical protein
LGKASTRLSGSWLVPQAKKPSKFGTNKARLANFTIFVVNTNSTRQTVFKGSQGMNFRSIDFSWMEEFGGIPLRQ